MAKLSVAHNAYASIKELILRFHFKPGQHVNEVSLAEQLKVSRTPLREALNRLVAEGLLEVRDRGFSIPDINPNTVQALFEARMVIECALVRLACERASDEELGALTKSVEISAAVSPDSSVDELVRLDREFHETVAELARNPELLNILKNINERIHLVRWIKMDGNRGSTQAEHKKIAHQLSERDADGAEALMRNHISHRYDEILSVVKDAYAYIHTAQYSDSRLTGNH